MFGDIFIPMIFLIALMAVAILLALALESKDWWKVIIIIVIVYIFLNAERIKELEIVKQSPILLMIIDKIIDIKGRILDYFGLILYDLVNAG
jgi:hypothetical protein